MTKELNKEQEINKLEAPQLDVKSNIINSITASINGITAATNNNFTYNVEPTAVYDNFIQPQLSIKAIAPHILSENPYTNNYIANFVLDGMIDNGAKKLAFDTPYDPYNVHHKETKYMSKTYTQIANKIDITEMDKNFNGVQRAIHSVTQSVFAAENSLVMKALNEAAQTSGNIIKTNSFDFTDLSQAAIKLQSSGLSIGAVIISTDLKPQIMSWGADAFSQFIATNNFGAKIDMNVENSLSIIQSANFLGYNWLVIPSNDIYKVIEPGTAYVVSDKQLLGGFSRSEGFTTTYPMGPNTSISYAEYFACLVANPQAVYKIQVNN